MSLRVIFMGTPQFAVPTLAAIIAAGHQVVAVYSQPPRPAGRGMTEKKSPVHQLAEKSAIPVFTPKNLKGEAEQAAFESHNCDVAVVVAYGMLLPKAILDAPRLGCYNGHASLLPRWRGAAPIQRAIMAGDSETAATIMKIEEGLDTGPVALVEKITIEPDMTAGKLHDKLSTLSAELMVRALAALERNQLDLVAQSQQGVTYAEKINKAESRIDWARPAFEVHNHIRGLSPFPGAWCEMELGGKPQRVKILRSELATGSGAPGTMLEGQLTIACKNAAVRLVRLQRAGKQPQNGDKFLRGNRISKVL